MFKISTKVPPLWRELALFGLIMAIFYGLFLTTNPLGTHDEARYAEIIREMLINNNYITPTLNFIPYLEKPPLFYWLGSGLQLVFGEHIWSLRLLPVLFSIITCLVCYAMSYLFYNYAIARVSTAMLATALLYFIVGHTINLDMALTCFLTLALLAFIRGISHGSDKARRYYLWGFYILVSLAVLTKGLIGLVIPTMIIGLWIVITWQWQLLKKMHLFTGIVLATIVIFPWHYLVNKANPGFWQFYIIDQHIERFLNTSDGHYEPIWYFIPVAFLGFFPWIMYTIPAFIKTISTYIKYPQNYPVALYFVIWALSIFIFYSFAQSKLTPYILPMFPAMAILTALYLKNYLHQYNPATLQSNHQLMFFLMFLMAFIAFISTIFPHTEITKSGIISIRILSYHLVAVAIIAYVCLRLVRFSYFLMILALLWASFCGHFYMRLPSFEPRSVRIIAEKLLPILTPKDRIVSYDTYFQELPYYLQRKIIVVNWHGELKFGASIDPKKYPWLMNSKAFWKIWNSDHTVYAFTTARHFTDFIKGNKSGKYFLLSKTPNIILVTNKKDTSL